MTGPLGQQFNALKERYPRASLAMLPSGAALITVPDHALPPGWNRTSTTIHFIAPPGYPAAQPDCFWVEPSGFRLQNGGTPQGTNDSNPIPEVGGKSTTWFSWHLQGWYPNRGSLVTYFTVILRRLQSLQ
jgi:hypothetical protein